MTAPGGGRRGRGAAVLVGFVVLHVLCCGAAVLGWAGLLAAAGGLLGQPLLVAAGVLLAAAAVAVGVRRARACAVGRASTAGAPERPDRATG